MSEPSRNPGRLEPCPFCARAEKFRSALVRLAKRSDEFFSSMGSEYYERWGAYRAAHADAIALGHELAKEGK